MIFQITPHHVEQSLSLTNKHLGKWAIGDSDQSNPVVMMGDNSKGDAELMALMLGLRDGASKFNNQQRGCAQ